MGVEPIELTKRARELAATGEFQYVYEIERRLLSEGCGSAERTFRGNPDIKTELRALIAAHWHAPTSRLSDRAGTANDLIRLNEAARERQSKRQ